ncbi:MAG: Xaa-Pro aminopeptidase [Phycisphaerae bacterium]|nr:Xaa-Pro aminopeptidase [Phycisphaerae bacterium]
MSANLLTATAPPNVYRDRRRRLGASLRRPMTIFSGSAAPRNYPANTYVFRAASTYLYFGGPPIEGAAMLIEPGNDGESGCVLFCEPAGPDDEVWLGPTPTDADLAGYSGLLVSAVRDPDKLMTSVSGRGAVFAPVVCPRARETARRCGIADAASDDLLPIILLRLRKDEHELAAMRRAARVTIEAHAAAARAIRPGRVEADVAAAFHAVLAAHQHQPSFNPIISVRGEVLHCSGYPNHLDDGALLLIDAGSEEPGGYACDVTRVYPVSGRFTPEQRAVYDAVHRAMSAGVAACTVGTRYRDVHFLTARVLCEGLVAAELLKGDPAALADRRAHTLFFTHGVGHLIGLDVHDMEDFGDLAGYAPGRQRPTEFGSKFLRLDRDLESGMCVTIEPGVYLSPAIWKRSDLVAPFRDVVNLPEVEALLARRFGGVRLEQTVHVRTKEAGGPEALSDALPVGADEALATMRGA